MLVEREQSVYYAAAALIVAATALLFIPVLDYQFVNLDDEEYVTKNSALISLNWEFVAWAFTTYHAYNYHPLTWISLAIDRSLWGWDPFGYHLTNLIIHVLNTGLVFLLAFRLVRAAATGPARPERWQILGAAFTAALFGMHPLRVESVAWVTERKDVLCAFFFLLSLVEYLNAGKEGTPRRRLHYGMSLLFFTLAALSKPMAISLPLVLLIVDAYPLHRILPREGTADYRRIILEKLPYFGISIVLAAATVLAQRTSGQIRSIHEYALSERLLTAAHEVLFYIEKMFMPTGLAPFYPILSPVTFSPRYAFALGFTAVVSAACILLWKRSRIWACAWLYYLITVFPTLGIVQVGGQAGADRYTYLPLLGPTVLVGMGLAILLERIGRATTGRMPVLTVAVLLIVTLFGALGAATRQQLPVWKDSVALWTREIAAFPFNVSISYLNRGRAFADAGDHQRAIYDFTTAVQMDPLDAESYTGRGKSHYKLGNHQAACRDFDQAITIAPLYAEAHAFRSSLCVSGK